MGILGSIMNGFKKNVAEMAWSLYEEARKRSTVQLEKFLQNEPNYVKKAAVLLALAEKDSYQTEKIYKQNNRAYDIQLGNLSSYYRFKPLVDRFFLKYAKENCGLY